MTFVSFCAPPISSLSAVRFQCMYMQQPLSVGILSRESNSFNS